MAEVERAKGTREVNPEDKLLMNHVVDNLRRIFELYGFLPLETPTLQKFDVLASKYAGGAEILKETFKLNDQGKREIALRYDLTVPLALYIALNPNIKLPFKRYEVGKVFRDGPISSERFREFWQCDVDIIGSSSMLAEAELINLAFKAFKEFDLDVEIKINNREILDAIMKYAGIDSSKIETIILTIDKLDKIHEEGVKKEKKTTVKAYIIPIKTTEQSFKLLNNIRDDRINADIDIKGRNLSKNLDYANVLSIPYVIFIGDDEIKLQKYKLRDMKTGKEELLNYQQLINKL